MRGLERDGILTRTVRAVMPPHVSYALTPMGTALRGAAAPLPAWSDAHLPDIDAPPTTHSTSSFGTAP